MEVWQKHNSINNLYVSNLGNLKLSKRFYINCKGEKRYFKEKILKQSQTGKGYKCNKGYYSVRIDNILLKAHRLVAETFLENKLLLKQVNHIDGNSLNNRVDNLEWISNMDNQHHSLLNRSNLTSKYIGVYYRKDRNNFSCEVKLNGNRYRKNGFENEEDAYLYLCDLRSNLNIKTKYA